MDEQGRLGVKRAPWLSNGPVQHHGTRMGGSRCEARARGTQPKIWWSLAGKSVAASVELDRFLEERLPNGREETPWSATAMILILSRHRTSCRRHRERRDVHCPLGLIPSPEAIGVPFVAASGSAVNLRHRRRRRVQIASTDSNHGSLFQPKGIASAQDPQPKAAYSAFDLASRFMRPRCASSAITFGFQVFS